MSIAQKPCSSSYIPPFCHPFAIRLDILYRPHSSASVMGLVFTLAQHHHKVQGEPRMGVERLKSLNFLIKTDDLYIGIKNVMEDQYPLIYLSIILKSYFARKRRLADGDTKRKLADPQTDTLS